MEIILFKILPLVAIFFLAYFLKKTGVFKSEDGGIFLKLVFYVAAPALIFVSLQKIELNSQFFLLPFIAAIVILISFSIAYLSGKLIRIPKKTLGTFLLGSSIINTGFTFPFLLSIYGEQAIVPVAFFDLGNSLLVFSFLYFIACRYGEKGSDVSYAIKKILISPPLWGVVLGLLVNVNHITVTPLLLDWLQVIGNLLVPLTMLALGFYFSFKIKNLPLLSLAIALRMVVGFLVGILLTSLFGLTGLVQNLVIILCASPVGYNTITFSSLEELDKEFAASIVSVAILIGMIIIPLLVLFL